MCRNGWPKAPLRQASTPHVVAALAALTVAADDVSGINQISDTVVFFRDDGKPMYSFTFSATANPSVLREVPDEAIESVEVWYRTIAHDQELERVSNLLVASLQTEGDVLRSFLSAWTAMEIFINKTFRSYEEQFFQELNEGDESDARRQYFERIRSVMKDKYRLTDKFTLIAYLLCPENADEDVRRFKQVKEYRDNLSHTQDIREENLPIGTVQELGRRYLRLHLAG